MGEDERAPTSNWSDPLASDADRQRFVELLRYHYGTGLLDDEELHRRLDLVLNAPRLGDLYRTCHDLPYPPPDAAPRPRR
ncbi:MAG: DUF1707 domain-containing protein [Actinomycetota bacterium]|jgi:hypothetical protein|nr:DUF1707 domain-containing protein [Actinomycetota bacterium]